MTSAQTKLRIGIAIAVIGIALAAFGLVRQFNSSKTPSTNNADITDTPESSNNDQTKETAPSDSSQPPTNETSSTTVTFTDLNPSSRSPKKNSNINVITRVKNPSAVKQIKLKATMGSQVLIFDPELADVSGNLSWTFKLPDSGSWQIQAYATGDQYSGSSETVTLTVVD